jgi:hypothetical protein
VFTIEEEEGEIIRYRRTKITFNPLHSESVSSWISPEIDTINLLDFTSRNKYLFNSLKERGYRSYFIDLFASNELEKVPFKDPEYDNNLLKRKTNVVSGDETTYHYHLNGGSLVFQRILTKDPSFWLELLRACNETNLLKISELHIAGDSTKDRMKYVTESIRKGHYESPVLDAIGFYTLNGIRHHGPLRKKRDVLKY